MKKTCCLCGGEFDGYGNDPAPLKESGECCDRCNAEKVLPTRFEAVLASGEISAKTAK